jgi:hypothetical protein
MQLSNGLGPQHAWPRPTSVETGWRPRSASPEVMSGLHHGRWAGSQCGIRIGLQATSGRCDAKQPLHPGTIRQVPVLRSFVGSQAVVADPLVLGNPKSRTSLLPDAASVTHPPLSARRAPAQRESAENRNACRARGWPVVHGQSGPWDRWGPWDRSASMPDLVRVRPIRLAADSTSYARSSSRSIARRMNRDASALLPPSF